MNIIIRLLVTALAAMVTAYILPGVHLPDFKTALILALVLAILNLLVKPVLILLTLPVTVITLGLFLLVINAVIILLAANLVDRFEVDGFFWALLFSIVLSVINSIMHGIAGGEKD
ncbi:phage holin family protein [Chitinophaga agri]|uniref:Phage holin family protein n=1 Tax=Chitinophaga agri TaxID=2703787 RepID=A0A6B9ZI57_9BACT|nr:phage holin family protein [Chitinophaga agri]QHS61726.1 phage holin family protein [Chitinophaga agri]